MKESPRRQRRFYGEGIHEAEQGCLILDYYTGKHALWYGLITVRLEKTMDKNFGFLPIFPCAYANNPDMDQKANIRGIV